MSLRRLLSTSALVLSLALPGLAATPGVADHAPDFTLLTPGGASLQLSSLAARSRVVLIVLRGYPGYQCPYSLQQFNDFQAYANKFAALGTQILFIYPGTSANLASLASDFAPAKLLAENVHLVIDPDFTVTNLYGLRWNATGETAYPSTFIVEKDLSVHAVKVGKLHGDHPTAADILAAVNADTTAVKPSN
jgi:peroxiredoxin